MKVCSTCGTLFTEPSAFCPHDGTPTVEYTEERPPDPLLGRVIDGRYRVERMLGEGGMGIVYLISHVVLGKRMALKVLRAEMAREGEVVQRFIQEAQSATSIGHPNIVDISDFGRLPDGSVYFVMEFLDGDSLSHVIAERGAMTVASASHVTRQIASALEAAHARGIVHRDLKPDNVYLVRRSTEPQFVKVLDFGIAKVGGANSKLTRTGVIFGTPHYMSPEQASGQSVDHRTDIYALGVMLYEMLVGRVPFEGDTFMGVLSKQMFERPVLPAQLHDVGPIEGVVMRALEKKPEDRYSSMAEMMADLDALAGPAPVLGRLGGREPTASGLLRTRSDNTRRDVATQPDLGIGSDTIVTPAPRRRGAIVAGVVAVIAVALAVGGAAFVSMGGAGAAAGTAATAPVGAPPQPIAAAQPTAAQPAAAAQPTAAQPAPGGAPSELPAAVVAVADARRLVEVISEPPGAEVSVDGVIVGNTPVRLPAPEAGEHVAQVRLRGFESASVMIGASTPESVRIALTAARTSSRRHDVRPTAATPESTLVAPTPTPSARTPRPTATEVVDPWAN